MRVITLAIALALALILPYQVSAEPGQEFDKDSANWVSHLYSNRGTTCCNLADCHPVEFMIKGNSYYFLANLIKFKGDGTTIHYQKWLEVPPDVVLHRANPTGSAVACYGDYTGNIFCFTPYMQS